jgi:hypothetical protein
MKKDLPRIRFIRGYWRVSPFPGSYSAKKGQELLALYVKASTFVNKLNNKLPPRSENEIRSNRD